MRRSFLRLIVTSVLLCWAAVLIIVVLYARNTVWDEARARANGVFLMHSLLEATPEADRRARMQALAPNFIVPFSLTTVDEVKARVGRQPSPGEGMSHAKRPRRQWFYVGFKDARSVLVAGPIDAVKPPNHVPIGMRLVLIGLPLIAALIAVRIDRRVATVEEASRAFSRGELGARVDTTKGPSNELAATFNAMADRIERLIRSRDELIQAVSHELGSPLARLRFHLEMLPIASERDTPMGAVQDELDALDALVAELLRYVQSDDHQIECTAFDPTQGLLDLAELARLEAPLNHAIEVQVAVAEGACIYGDQRLFLRAVENLLRNAVQHAHSAVLLELVATRNSVVVSVHDDGAGIPESLRDTVTTPFFRSQSDRSRETGGVGLGLAIVQRIMQRHGGRLTIAAAPLGGALVATHWPTDQRPTKTGLPPASDR